MLACVCTLLIRGVINSPLSEVDICIPPTSSLFTQAAKMTDGASSSSVNHSMYQKKTSLIIRKQWNEVRIIIARSPTTWPKMIQGGNFVSSASFKITQHSCKGAQLCYDLSKPSLFSSDHEIIKLWSWENGVKNWVKPCLFRLSCWRYTCMTGILVFCFHIDNVKYWQGWMAKDLFFLINWI